MSDSDTAYGCKQRMHCGNKKPERHFNQIAVFSCNCFCVCGNEKREEK